MCTNLLKQAGDFEELQGLVEDVSEKIEINVKVSEIFKLEILHGFDK